MATVVSNLNGLYKQVYADKLENLIPEASLLTKKIAFVEREKETGDLYHQPVVLTYEHGITYAAAAAGAFTLNSAISMNTKDAQVQGTQLLLRSALAYDAAAKASNDKKAFKKATQLLFENMMESITKRLELAVLYGGSGIGVGDSSANASATSTVVTLTTASWATGIWLGMEGAQINFYKQSDGTLVSSSADSIFTITSVNVDDKKLTISGTATGISALDTALGAGDCDIYFNGAKEKEMTGLNGIITNTGTLFNISASTYNLWKGNSYDVGGALNIGKILTGLSAPTARGLNEGVTVLLNPLTWANVASDLAALRKYDGSYKKTMGENGVEAIKFYSQNGEIELSSYNLVKQGEAFAIPMKQCMRIGAQDISFKTPGRGDEIFTQLADAAGFEVRVYTDQAVFVKRPAHTLKYTGIVNNV